MAYRMLLRHGVVALLACMACCQAMASVVITGTRLIYPANEKEITVTLNNNGELPVLVQTWIDSGDPNSNPTHSKSPFVLSPPVFRMDPKAVQSLRMIFTAADLPQDKESVYWFNLLEVPSHPLVIETTSILQMAFRSRIKVFYRPEALVGNANEAIGKVQWRVLPQAKGFALEARNASAFHVSLTGVVLLDGSQRSAGVAEMLEPQSTRLFALPSLKHLPRPGAQVEFATLNDYGAEVLTKTPLTP